MTEVVLRLSGWWSSFDWDRDLLRLCSAFHAVVALGMALVPDDVIETQATREVLAIAPREVWALMFGVLAVLVAFQHRAPRVVRLAVWFSVLMVGAWWLIGFGLAMRYGEGTAAFVLGLFLYAIWTAVAARLGLGKR